MKTSLFVTLALFLAACGQQKTDSKPTIEGYWHFQGAFSPTGERLDKASVAEFSELRGGKVYETARTIDKWKKTVIKWETNFDYRVEANQLIRVESNHKQNEERQEIVVLNDAALTLKVTRKIRYPVGTLIRFNRVSPQEAQNKIDAHLKLTNAGIQDPVSVPLRLELSGNRERSYSSTSTDAEKRRKVEEALAEGPANRYSLLSIRLEKPALSTVNMRNASFFFFKDSVEVLAPALGDCKVTVSGSFYSDAARISFELPIGSTIESYDRCLPFLQETQKSTVSLKIIRTNVRNERPLMEGVLGELLIEAKPELPSL
jgi:hypothetical protein